MNIQTNEPDYDANKPEEAGSKASDFIRDKIDLKDQIDPEVEDMKLMDKRYEEYKNKGICPKCKDKISTWEVGVTSPDDFDITGVRAKCNKCTWHFEFDW